MRVRFVFEGATSEIGLSDPDLARDIARLFPGAQLLDQPEGTRSRMEVGSHADGFYFREAGTTTSFPSMAELTDAVEFAVVAELLEQDSLLTHIHAAGAWTTAGAVLVTGPGGAGKSSCAFSWSVLGLPLFGDDVVRVDSDGLVSPFPRLIKVHRDRLTEFGLDATDTLFWDPDYSEVWFEPENAGGWMHRKGETALLAQIEYDGGDEVRLTEADDAEGLRILLDSVQPEGLPKEKSVDALIELLRGTRVLRVQFGSSRAMARLLVEMATEGASPLQAGPRGP